MTPSKFGGNEEHSRDWLDEVRGYMETTRPGMKALLLVVEKSHSLSTKTGLAAKTQCLQKTTRP